MDLYKIPSVEIFSAGTWNGDKYTESDLDEMVRAFEENKETVRPFLKLGHDEDQKLLQTNGLPAAGWIDRIYRVGQKLMADFVDIPKLIYELIERKAYRKVSSEIYWNISIGDKNYSRMLGAVALLGAETPGVMNLSDILGWYNLSDKFAKLKFYDENNKEAIIKVCEIINETTEVSKMEKTEKEILLEKELADAKAKIEGIEQEKASYEAQIQTAKEENQKLADEKAKLENDAKEYARKAFEASIESSVEKMLADKMITPAMKPFVAALLGDEKKEYTFGEKEKETKLSKFDLVKEILKLHVASDVNVDENSLDVDAAPVKPEDQLNTKIEKYAADNKVDYKTAYKIVMREKSVEQEIEETEVK